MEDKYAKAKHLFVKEKYNCAQAVACAFCQETGIPEEQLRALAASFGGGMGRLREVCGAVSGALLVLGALYGGYDPADTAAKPGTMRACRNLRAVFLRRMGISSAGNCSSCAQGRSKALSQISARANTMPRGPARKLWPAERGF